ncbi:MAG: DUF3833 family protein [Pseudomonadota bacterium]
MDGEAFEPTRPFRPEVFFLGRTEGWGVARGPTGRIIRRCRVTTDGRLDDAYEAIHFEELFSWDDGENDEWRWAMRRGLDGRYVAAEARIGSGIQGRHDGCDWLLSFRRPVKPEGGPRPRFVTRFTQIAPDVALKTARIFMFGLPVASLTAFHRRLP